MLIEDNKELLIEYVNKYPNNWSLGTEIRKLIRSNEESPGEYELRNHLSKIWNSYHQLSNEEELLIKKIANRL
jgi:hypothetical protein